MSFIISNTLQHLQHAEMLNRLNNYWVKNVSENQGSPRFNSSRRKDSWILNYDDIFNKEKKGPSVGIVKLSEGSLTALVETART